MRKLKVRFHLLNFISRAEAKIFLRLIDGDRIDELAGIHFIGGIPEGFEFAEGLHQFRAEHFGQQRGAGLAVAMFAGERAAVLEDDVGGLVDELAIFLDTGFASRSRR